jgi:uncharacterized protein (TIGR00369 family)
MSMLDAWKAAGQPMPPVAAHLGFELVELEDGRARFVLDADLEKHGNPMGTVQGGVIVAVADAAMGIAYASLLGEGETFTTLELKINYLKPVRAGRLVAEGSVLKSGRTVGLAECRVTDDSGSLVAYATSTCMTLRGESAEGR